MVEKKWTPKLDGRVLGKQRVSRGKRKKKNKQTSIWLVLLHVQNTNKLQVLIHVHCSFFHPSVCMLRVILQLLSHVSL